MKKYLPYIIGLVLFGLVQYQIYTINVKLANIDRNFAQAVLSVINAALEQQAKAK